MKKLLAIGLACGAAVLYFAACCHATEHVPAPNVDAGSRDADHAALARVLAAVVAPDGVRYAALVADHADLDRYRGLLAKATIPPAGNARKALFINAYNAWTLALVARHLPADQRLWPKWSIKDAGTAFEDVWKRYTFDLGGRRYTLDQVEHEILRPMGDPRIHFAINCGSRSCPKLAAKPYRAATLDADLDAATIAFVRDPGQMRMADGRLDINPILDWFAADFKKVGGVRAFLLAHAAAGPVKSYLAGAGKLSFFDYDWHLNQARGGR